MCEIFTAIAQSFQTGSKALGEAAGPKRGEIGKSGNSLTLLVSFLALSLFSYFTYLMRNTARSAGSRNEPTPDVFDEGPWPPWLIIASLI